MLTFTFALYRVFSKQELTSDFNSVLTAPMEINRQCCSSSVVEVYGECAVLCVAHVEGSRFYVRSTTRERCDVRCGTSGRFGARDPAALSHAVYKGISLKTSVASVDRLIALAPDIHYQGMTALYLLDSRGNFLSMQHWTQSPYHLANGIVTRD